jgi:profilin
MQLMAVGATLTSSTGSLTAFANTWDSYIDKLIGKSKDSRGLQHADKAAIIGLDGGAVWTSNKHPNAIKFQENEAENIAMAFKNKDFRSFMNSGIRAENVKYRFLREDAGRIVLAKMKGKGALTLQTSKSAIVISHTKEGMQQDNVNKAVNIIVESLESIGL